WFVRLCLLCLFLFLYSSRFFFFFFFFNDPAPTEIYTLSLHDALPISTGCYPCAGRMRTNAGATTSRTGEGCRRGGSRSGAGSGRSEEHTSELQSRSDLVCRLLLEKKKKKKKKKTNEKIKIKKKKNNTK